MGGEPFLFRPPEIAALTDWQILELYVNPAVRRAEDLDRERKGLPVMDRRPERRSPGRTPSGPDRELIPTRADYVYTAVTYLRWPRAHAEAEYDRQWPPGGNGRVSGEG